MARGRYGTSMSIVRRPSKKKKSKAQKDWEKGLTPASAVKVTKASGEVTYEQPIQTAKRYRGPKQK